MTKLYDFKDRVILDVKNYLSKHREINPIDNFEDAYYKTSKEFESTDSKFTELVNDTIYEVLNEMVNDGDWIEEMTNDD